MSRRAKTKVEKKHWGVQQRVGLRIRLEQDRRGCRSTRCFREAPIQLVPALTTGCVGLWGRCVGDHKRNGTTWSPPQGNRVQGRLRSGHAISVVRLVPSDFST